MIRWKVNGKVHAVDVPPDMPLLWGLRDVIGLTGTKYGCGMALCGYCQSGQIMSAAALLANNAAPSDTDIDSAMAIKGGIDTSSVEGAASLPYQIPALPVDLHSPQVGVPVQWWRSVGSTHTAFVAQVAEVRVDGDGSFQVERLVCAVDCGVAVNPDIIRAQMEGGIGFGLSAALHGAITLNAGGVEQSNFQDYPVLRINQMPKVAVHIVTSSEKPTGVGEPGSPVIAPAVTNAIYAASGKRLHDLPLQFAAKGQG